MEISALIGQTLRSVNGGKGDNEVTFVTETGKRFRMYHEQDCCEGVWLEDVCGDMSDLVGSPILKAEESSNDTDPPAAGSEVHGDDSYTWTFYHLATIKGYVTLRWFGTSNGYYSEGVSFREL